MATTKHNPSVKPKRFAALLAGFDTGNPSDAEAMNYGLAMRRSAEQCGMSIVDLLEHPDVRQAVDDQLQPKRYQSEELQIAIRQAAELREELTSRTRDVRKLADLLKSQETITAELREELAKLGRQTGARHGNAAQSQSNGQGISTYSATSSHCFGAQSRLFEVAGIVVALVLMWIAAFR